MGCKQTKEDAALEPTVPEAAPGSAGANSATEDPPASHAEQTPVAKEATPEEKALTQLKIVFESIDSDHNATVCKKELTTALTRDPELGKLIKEAGFNDKFDVLEQLDTNHDGRVTWDEFSTNLKAAAVQEVKDHGHVDAAELPADEKALKQLKVIFEALDANHDGAVSKDELSNAMNQEPTIPRLITEAGFNAKYYVLEQLDTNHDGRITWNEFEDHLKSAAKEEVMTKGDMEAAVVLEDQTQTEGAVDKKGWCC